MSTISRFHCRLIVFVHSDLFFLFFFFFGHIFDPARLGIIKAIKILAQNNKMKRPQKQDICFELGQVCGSCKGRLCDMAHGANVTQ